MNNIDDLKYSQGFPLPYKGSVNSAANFPADGGDSSAIYQNSTNPSANQLYKSAQDSGYFGSFKDWLNSLNSTNLNQDVGVLKSVEGLFGIGNSPANPNANMPNANISSTGLKLSGIAIAGILVTATILGLVGYELYKMSIKKQS